MTIRPRRPTEPSSRAPDVRVPLPFLYSYEVLSEQGVRIALSASILATHAGAGRPRLDRPQRGGGVAAAGGRSPLSGLAVARAAFDEIMRAMRVRGSLVNVVHRPAQRDELHL